MHKGEVRKFNLCGMFVVYSSYLRVGVLQLRVFLLRLIAPLLQPLQEKWVGAFPLLFAMHAERTAVKVYLLSKELNQSEEERGLSDQFARHLWSCHDNTADVRLNTALRYPMVIDGHPMVAFCGSFHGVPWRPVVTMALCSNKKPRYFSLTSWLFVYRRCFEAGRKTALRTDVKMYAL